MMLVEKNGKNWDELLDLASMAYQTTQSVHCMEGTKVCLWALFI